mgnify:CR=1 FL=1
MFVPKKINRLIVYSCCITVMMLLYACSGTKYVPKGDALYTGASIKVETDSASKKHRSLVKDIASSLTRPKPNRSIFGVKFKLHMYNLAGNPKSEKSFRGWLKNKIGEPPVLLSQVNVDNNVNVIRSSLENTGFFHVAVSGDTTVKGKKAKATYTVTPGERYYIDSVFFEKDSSNLSTNIRAASKNTLLKHGNPFDLETIKAERNRLDVYLKEKGFYYFDPGYLIIQADSTIGAKKVNLYVKVKPNTTVAARSVFSINDIFIFPTFRINSTTSADTLKKNAAYYKGYYVIDRRNQYKPQLFQNTMQFKKGEAYNRTDQNLTLNRLVGLGIFKFVKNRFEVDSTRLNSLFNDSARVLRGLNDSIPLNTYYYLTPLPKNALKLEPTGSTKSNNLTGANLTLGWRRRNTFKGGEILMVNANAGFEVQLSGQLKGYNTYRYGLEGNLSFPKFLIPFYKYNLKGGFVPRTNLLVGYEVLTKQKLYTLNSFKAGYGYVWKGNAFTEYDLKPIAINYIQPIHVSQQYTDSAANNPTLQKAIEKQFILGGNYNFNYNELVGNAIMTGWYFNGNVDLSGNIIGGILGANVNKGRPKNIANAQFSQYVKLEADTRFYLKLSKKSVLANRVIIGYGLPWGNSTELPFVKQFFSGGNNSIRAFRSRSLGPGTFKDTVNTAFLADQSGDIKLEFNTEYRTKLYSVFDGAVFIDAGNVWLKNEDPNRPGSKFSSKFLSQLAIGAGAGLRVDVSILVLRLDVAFPIRKPWLPENERWVFDNIRFGSKTWRQENLIFNLGIGFPF